MKRAWLFLVVAALWSATDLFAATITLTAKDPRVNNSDLVDRDWGARLRNFGLLGDGSEIYIGPGNLSFARNRKVADMIWDNTPSGVNKFTLTYAPSPAESKEGQALLTMTASGSKSEATQFYDFETPIANPNEVFNSVLIFLKSAKNEKEIRITNLVMTITGESPTKLGDIQVVQEDIFGQISDIDGAYTSGFTLTGNVVYPVGFSEKAEERPMIGFFALFDRTHPAASDLTLTKSHSGNFIQGQIGATYTVTVSNVGAGPTTGTVTVVDNFPPALLPGVASGTGWACNTSVNTATCTRSDVLAAGASYPPITLTVNVASTVPPSVVNAAAVTGGNDGNSENNTVADPTTIIRGPDLNITKTANGSFTQGQAGGGYTLAVANIGGVATSSLVTVTDNLPTGLSPETITGTGWTCGISGNTATCTRGNQLAPGASYPPISLTVNVAGTAPVSVTNTATVGGGGDFDSSNNTATLVTSIARAPDLTISKSHTGNFIQGQTATYTITVTNIGPVPNSGAVIVADPMSLPLTPRTGSGSGWACDVLLAQIRCLRSDTLAAGASYPPITMTASIATDADPTLVNTATVSSAADGNTSNNSASDTATVVPAADLTVTKSHTGNFTQGVAGSYTLTVGNVGGSPTSGSVTVLDDLPAGLAPTAASGTGWTCTISAQGVNCERSDPLAPAQSYPAITLTVDVERNAPASLTNTAIVFGGGETNPSNNTSADPTTIAAGPNLTITKSHTGNFTQGQTGTYTLTVTNTGASPTSTPVVVNDNLPIGLASTGASGTGWTCAPGGQSFSCTRNDPLAPGASYPPLTLTVQVAVDAPASATNTATISGGGDVDTSNNSVSDPTTIIAVPDLTLTKTHTGSFLQGQVGATYTLTVTNTGGGPTSSMVTVSDTVPAGLTPTATDGVGWVCTILAQTVSCTRSDILNSGASYPDITLRVDVAPAAPPSLTNSAIVSGGGEINTANNTADDITTIGLGPDLTISKSHSGTFLQGQTGAIYTITVSNPGSPPTSGVVTATDNVPAGLTPTSASGGGWICNISGQDVTCTRSDPLVPGDSYPPITLTVNVQSGAPESVTNAVSVAGGGDVNPANNSNTDVTPIIPGADLTVTKSHTGNFTQGQIGATYTITVTNSGVGPTTTLIAVTDTFPLGLTPTTAVGGGWSCQAGAQGIGCTRSDPIAAGASAPPITVTLNVASDAPATTTNTVSVSGGGETNAGNNTASDPTTILAGADLSVTKTHSGDFTQGLRGATYTLTVHNGGGVPTGGPVTAIDVVPTGLVPFAASGTGWTCAITGQAVTCERDDPLSPGGNYPPITVTVDIAPDAPASVTNTARVTGGGDINSLNNTVDDVTPITPGPDLTLTKTHTGNFIQGQTAATFTVTVTNQGAAPTNRTVIVSDPVELPFQPTAASGSGWTCEVLAGSVQCQRSDALAAGASYPPLTITVNISAAAPATATNTASVAGGGDVNTGNNTASDPVTISPGPDLTLTKTHTAILTQGQRGAFPGLDFTLTVQNIGRSATTGTITLIDNVPPGLIPLSAAGTGWTCSTSLQSVTCTREDALAAAASFPPVTLTVDVESDAPVEVTNTATISGGGDINTANNTASDLALVNRGQNLTVNKTHTGNFSQGQKGVAYTIIVTNTGDAPTFGTTTLIDTVPTGIIPTAASGTGWTCTVSGQTVNCTRANSLAPGASFEPVTLTVDVAENLPASVVNTAIIAGGGDVLSGDNVAQDITAITSGPDPTITKTHPNSFGPGQTGVIFILTVTNRGASPTQGVVEVVDDLPEGLTAKSASGSGWTCELLAAIVACSRTDVLAPGASYPSITLTVDVASNLALGSTLTNRVTVSAGGDVNTGNNTAQDSEILGLRPDLRISKTHSGNFIQGQTGATYRMTVSNVGQDVTNSEVKVQDRLPAGLSPSSATGSGWTCTISTQTVSCNRSDALAPGGTYPPITLAVTVAPDALPQITNTATVSGGGDDSGDTASDVTTIEAGGPYTFAHVPVGGGYTTDFLISNTGATGATTELILTDQQGNPFPVILMDPSTSATLAMGSSFPVSIAPAGTSIFRAAPVNASDSIKIGWARLVPSVDHVGGVALFDYLQQSILRSTAGVFGGYPINMATMPVDNDDRENRFTGFAVANSSNANVNLTLYVLDENGGITDVLSPPELNPLGPLKQVAKFLHEYVPTKLRFKGSMVLVGQNGKTFAVVALVQAQGLVTVIPVVPSKSPQVP